MLRTTRSMAIAAHAPATPQPNPLNAMPVIGEFLIVVFGIIAAFQLDSWKEDRDDARLVTEYLTDIEVGLANDSLYYEMALIYFDSIKAAMKITSMPKISFAQKLMRTG